MTEIPKRDRHNRRVMRDLIDTFNATILFQWREPLPFLLRDRAIKRDRVETAMATRAAEHNETAILPWWSRVRLDRPGRVAVVHAAPHKSDVGTGALGNGVSAHRVRTMLSAYGIEPSMVTDLATVPVWRDRMPTVDEMAEWHRLLLDALDAADVNFVLLHGQHALHSWRPDLTLGQSVGKVGLWGSRWWVMPTYHAESAYQAHGTVTREEWAGVLYRFAELVQAPDPFKLIGNSCIARTKLGVCGGSAYAWDEDGLPWCDEHWDDGRQGHLDAVKGPKKRKQLPGQLSLELGEIQHDTHLDKDSPDL